MCRNIILFSITFFFVVQIHLSGQDSSYVAYEDNLYKLEVIIQHDTVIVQDTLFISHLNDITRIFGMSFDEYSKRILGSVGQKDSAGRLSQERIYLNYLLPMYYPSYIKHRYIARNYSVEVIDNYLKMDINNLSKPLSSLQDSLEMDVMLMCRGDVNTDNFLRSPYYRSSCLEQLFLSIDKTRLTNIKGVNLYFPDFSFKEKRAMAQFVKSASLIIDSCNVKSIRDLKLYVTFDRDNGKDNYAYILGLTQMVDSVLLVNTKSVYWPGDSVLAVSKVDAEKASWWSKVENQFYLARFTLKPFPQIDKSEELSPENLRTLINADYPYNNWENYFFALIGILLLVITVFIFYRFNPYFSYFLNNNITYFFSLVIMLILEIYLLFVCMVEAMSNENVFTFGGEDKNTFLLLPLLFIFIVPMLNILSKRREKP
ncbi:MAG: hypothetical protein ACK5KN_06555 [Dysgonomonas sp.]|uniref:hypothetical protein n=1 Tax=unclassified Dysgonomonas TaxID=2630389 RepID=UPI0025BE36B2|nr:MULTISPECIES: hypothetical protein [unclassified Dysgonomonas]MDR2002455.1 hypothetical protein [Prevotella sp.]HMM02933.1 hypothetical protein [Dysgonomonas sp.]